MTHLPTLTAPDAISAFLADSEAGWKARDAAAMFRSAADTAEWISIVGIHWRGKADVVAAHQAYLDTFLGGVGLDLDRLERADRLADGAWLVVARWRLGPISLPNGEVRPACDNLMNLAFASERSGLALRHGADIEVVAALAAANPIRP